MAKEKLKPHQFYVLEGLNLTEKLNKLFEWKRKGEITPQQFNHFSNLWISRETKKKLIGVENPLKHHKNENQERPHHRSLPEAQMIELLNRMQSLLNAYIASRDICTVGLTPNDVEKFQKLINEYPYFREIVNQLLVIGLRFPNEEINKFCNDYILEHRMNKYYSYIDFWVMLWSNGNLVPLDAVRLMLASEDQVNFKIKPVFPKELIEALIPLITIQRDKEITRLQWAQGLDGHERQFEIARKTRRLNAFNILLNAAEEYIKQK